MQDIQSLIESLHPLEVKVLKALADPTLKSDAASVREEDLVQATGLDPAQVSMALGWLLAKNLINVQHETCLNFVSLTEVGQEYFEKSAPVERILSALKAA